MKGTLHKTEQGWVVDSFYETPSSLPLHPEFIEAMDTCFTSKFTQEVEFEVVRHCKYHNSDPSKNSVCTMDCGPEEVSYAKLIKPESKNYTGEYPFFKKFSMLDETPTSVASDRTTEIPRLMYRGGKEIRSYHSPKVDEMLKEIEEEEKAMFEMEQQLDIPSHMRWHNSKPNDVREVVEDDDKFEKFLDNEIELGLSPKDTIERIKWYYQTYFKSKSTLYTEEQIKKAWYTLERFDGFEDFLKKLNQQK
jgi:hypothetical protein